MQTPRPRRIPIRRSTKPTARCPNCREITDNFAQDPGGSPDRRTVYVNDALAPDPQGMATAAASAAACATCAMATMFFQVEPLPRTALSGTTMVSPGSIIAARTPPDHIPLVPLVTSPLERRIKMPALLANGVAPPARERYQLPFFFGVEVSALMSNTLPTTKTNPGCLGIFSEAPARSSISLNDPAKPRT